MSRILVTGAAGFIGRSLCSGLVERRHAVLGVTRGPATSVAGAEFRPVGDIGPQTEWSRHLEGVEIVIHLANRAHHRSPDNATANEAEAAAALARAASKAGVRRLIYMSSIKAMGESTPPGTPFRPADPALPRDAYGRGKLAIEQALRAAARAGGLELVILRPPLVYGPGVKANFRALMRLIESGAPLPFAGIDNRRSILFLANLVDLVSCAIVRAGAGGQVLLARDTVDLSTPELIRLLAAGLHRRARLFTLPPLAAAPLRRLPVLGPLVARMTVSLQVDDSETRAALGWHPPVSPEVAIFATAKAFRERS